ncbi:S41 family peptidase [Saccharococcus sp. Marseille-Q5394]|uniref:S41 family peptidase n=1 Tax=Saccharococcus sp. Marseille-Q5394 TaxID=2972778 RepID=UPI0021C5F5D1|nr:S41 family peptidase [Saccharococcus sp. Marseille-Q5394]
MLRNHIQRFIMLFVILLVMLPLTTSAATEPIDEIRQLIKDYYVDDVPASVLSRSTGKEITNGLDPHSAYMSKQEYEAFINGIEQRIVGIGVVLEESVNGIKVISVIKDGPAFKAGIVPGDVITHVGGNSLKGQSVQAAVPLISGKENTDVSLTIEREKTEKPVKMTIRRAEIHLPTVESEMLGGNIGYIRLNSFATDSARDMEDAIRSLKGAEGFIVDIRNNGGGYITAAQEIAGFFPGVEQAFQLREKNKKPAIYPSVNQKQKITGPVSLLINEYSASASEMLAVNLKEQKAATLYGESTYGKGTMQSMYAFNDGSVLKMTTARFYSPKGIAVDKVGVTPDIKTRENEELITAHYEQLLTQYKDYARYPKLENVKTTKRFTVNMTKEMDWRQLGNKSAQLIEIGGKESNVRFEVKDGKTIEVIPEAPLLSGKKYVLIIHPVWMDKKGKALKKGIYLDVTVK